MVRQLLLFTALAATAARGQDAVLAKLLGEAAAASPELAQARSAVEAERARVPQAGALPDPSLSLGIQNDGFKRIAIGTMETSFLSIGVTQPLPWPGKRALRAQVASLDQKRAEAQLARVALGVEGGVRRAYLSLLLARGQVDLLAEQERLWTQAEQAARSRYEAGQAPQSDLLRAQLENARLQQRKWALEAEVAIEVAGLNRLRARPLEDAVETRAHLADFPDPPLPAEAEAQADAVSRSPELQLAAASLEQAGRRVELLHKEERPDFALSAAVMPRGGLEPMWSLGLSVGLPIFGTQARAASEGEERRAGSAQGAAALSQIVGLRVRERLATLSALIRTNQHYRTQLLVLSEATTQSALAQYQVGRIPFAAVLEALSGYVSDRTGYLASVAQAQLVEVAQREVSLDPAAPISGGSSAAMPGTASASIASAAAAPTTGGAGPAAAQPRGMGGM